MESSLAYGNPMADLYDEIFPGPLQWGDDRELYLALAREYGDPVLELAVGTGRVARYLAERGIRVVGLDASLHMLERAHDHVAHLAPEERRNITLEHRDMRSFNLGKEFPLVIIPFTAFQHLLTIEDQKRTLWCIHQHLGPNGRLVIDLFNPRLEWLTPDAGRQLTVNEVRHPITGRNWKIFIDSHQNFPHEQIFHEEWRFVELDENGRVTSEYYWRLTLRWLYRFEMQHLLERCGFEVMALWGDYQRDECGYGRRQIWLARK